MPVEPPRKISETQIIRREEGTNPQKRKKPQPGDKEQKKDQQQPSGKVDIKV